jgi:hypothetical protein
VLAVAVTLLALTLGLRHAIAVDVAESAPSREQRIKAAFLYNFAKFVEWPDRVESSVSSFAVCLLGWPTFATAVDTIDGKMVRGKPIVVKTVVDETAIKDCQIVFLDDAHRDSVITAAALHRKYGILTVSESADFASSGGMIGMYVHGDKVRFRVNTGAAKRSGLTVSSRLLNIADRVIE